MKVVIVYLVFISISSQAQKIDFHIEGEIPLIKQAKSLDCWITVTTMMKSWKDGKVYSVEEVAVKIGEPWHSFFKNNSGLSFEDQELFINSIDMQSEPPASYMLEAYLALLKTYGPLWITTGDGFIAHARVLIGITGDGTYEHSEFIFIDPSTGTKVRQNALEFVHEFEKEAIIANEDNWERLRIQIHHY